MSQTISEVFVTTKPEVDDTVFVAPNAIIVGKVVIGSNSSVWYNAVIRGDIAPITIGKKCNIQDGSIIHVDFDAPTVIKDRVSIGHGAIVHGAQLEEGCLIGMGAKVLSRSKIGKNAIVAAGAVIMEDMVVPEDCIAAGVPAKIIGKIGKSHLERMDKITEGYDKIKNIYRETI